MSQPAAAETASDQGGETAIIDDLVGRARAAMASLAGADQARIDEAVTALAWSLYKPERAKELAELAVAVLAEAVDSAVVDEHAGEVVACSDSDAAAACW